MNNRQIECFLEAARLLNFTRAAENLLPQPAVSRYISALEEELRRTRQSLANAAPALRLGINKSWQTTGFLPKVVEMCQQREPKFRVVYECLDFRELCEGLKAKQLDAVIALGNDLQDTQEFTVERITSIRRVILYSDLLPNADTLMTPDDFYPYDFLITDDPLVRKLAEESELIFQDYHFVPRFRTVSNQETVMCGVENGTGVALLDEWCHARYHPHLHCIHVDEYMPVALARRRDTESSTVELFWECLTEYFRNGGV